ncbi:acyltransferase domain-containing protein [Streptomyces sp. NPDC096198]|uniref:acyltransferase domain-containing protein n=1 Tax=Streptomyces sp. NPDC096198 TaxID=3366080 RepID=UPI0038015E6D
MSFGDAGEKPISIDLETPGGVASWLRSRVAELVGREIGDRDDDELFSGLGMDSMRATSLMAALSRATGKHWSPALLWAHPTIGALAARIVAGDVPGDGPDAGGAPAARRTPAAGPRGQEPVAVVGMACRFPDADGVDAFWNLLEEGKDAVRTVPEGRWPVGAPRSPAPFEMTTTEAGFLDGPVDEFDPLFFGISPREAVEMDPQQRLFLEVAWEALEDAGITESDLAGSATGVFAGAIWHDYADLAPGGAGNLSSHSATGRALNMIANRLSYVLGLRGPSVVLDSACSSSLLAVHLACQSIWTGESSMALAGGVNLLLSPGTMASLSKFGGLSPDGRCKAFDARADGFGRGEGCGVVVLKPLSRALADGDGIWCTIRATAANNDGLSNGLTAPNPAAQEEVLRTAYGRAGVAPHEVHYVETHGTGTALGDPIEAMALGEVLGRGRPQDAPLRIGSVKTNTGHLEAAAGIAGFIKTALALKHRRVPRNLHFEQPNPHIPFGELRLRVPTEAEPWPESGAPYAGVSAFGWGGTNVHAVLEGHRDPAPMEVPAVAARGLPGRPRIAFVCSPYGQQWVGMARGLYRTEPVFRSVLEECDRELARHAGFSLVEELFLDEPQARTGDVGVMQPVVFAVQVGLAAWLESCGVRPGAVVGHSLGEIAACVIAGVLDLPDAVRLVHHYSDQQRRVAGPDRGMAVVELDADALQARLAARNSPACVAARNGPRTTALAGGRAELEEIVAGLKAEGVLCAMIRVDLAAHSPAIDPVMADLERALAGIAGRPGRIPVISSVTGRPLDPRDVTPGYFARNLREQVRLADATAHLLREKFDVLLEISANPVLVPALQQSADDFGRTATVLPTMRRGDDDRTGLAETLEALARLGTEIRLPGRGDASDAELFVLSAKSADALRELAGRAAVGVGGGGGAEVADCAGGGGAEVANRVGGGGVAGSGGRVVGDGGLAGLVRAALPRAQHPYRLAVVARDREELADALAAHARGERTAGLYTSGRAAGKRPRVAFVFPGQGSQWPGMGRELMHREPVFHAALRECDEAARAFVDWSVLERLTGVAPDPAADRIDVVQPVLFAVEVALAALWRSWGVEPDAVVGHSMGELAAAHVAGVLSLEDAARIICLRSRLLRRTSGRGAMLAVELTMEESHRVLAGREGAVSVAVNNGPRSTVLSGDREVLAEVARELEADDVFCRWVKVDVASHSPQMDPLRPELLSALEGLAPRPAAVPVYSTVTGDLVGGTEMTAAYWVDNLREPVLFGDQIARLVREGVDAFAEMSPHPILLPAVEQVAAGLGAETAVLPSLRRNEGERDTLLASLGRLHVLGVPARLDRVATPAARGRGLPHYPWQRERFWHGSHGAPAETGSAPLQGLLGERIDSAVQPGTHYWQTGLNAGTAAVRDHLIGGAAVVPGAAFVDMALSAARQVLPGDRHVLSEVLFQQPLVLPGTGSARVQAVLEGSGEQRARIRFFVSEENGPVCVAEAELSAADAPETPSAPADGERLAARTAETLDGPGYYRALAACGLGYGPAYQGITRIARGDGEALAWIAPPSPEGWPGTGHTVPPALLDCALQTAVAPLLGADWTTEGGFLSEGMSRAAVHGTAAGEVRAHAVCRAAGDGRWEVDVLVLAPDGTPLAEVLGLRIVRLASVPVLAAAPPAPPDGNGRSGSAGPAAAPGALRERLAALPGGAERRTALEAAVRENVAQVVKLPARRVDPDRPLRSLGIDSLMSLELRNRLEGTFGIRLSATLIWNHPTIRDLALFLAGKLGLVLDEEGGDPAEGPGRPAAGDPVAPAPASDGGAAAGGAAGPEELLERELAELNERMETI